MYKLKKLSSGLRILTVPVEHTGVFTMLVLVGTGSKYETKKINGISHFLEHMFFKGTRQRPEPGAVNRALDSVGAQYNAFTSKEVTGYWVKAARQHFDLGLDIVSDILTEPLLSNDEIEKERGVILQELRMRNDDPISRANILLEDILWGDQPAGWWIIGSEKNIKSFKREDFINYFDEQYVAKNTLIVLGGAYPKNAEEKIKKAFAKLKSGNPHSKKKTIDRQTQIKVLAEKKQNEASNLIVGFRGHSMHDPRRYAEDLMGVILGGNSSSRLYMEIREKRGLAYYVRAGATRYADSGHFDISAGVPHGKIAVVLKIIADEIRRIKKNGVTKLELESAKEYIRGNTKIELEDSSALTSFFGEQALFYPKILTPDDYLKKIGHIGTKEIQTMAQTLFVSKSANLVVVGASKNSSALKKIFEKI
ncbi:MAG: pitrilysin family protein [Patescibacteria group bacterium]